MSGNEFTYDGKRIEYRAGQSLAAALTEAGERAFRETPNGKMRAIFCGMGVCQDCLVTVDGAPNRRACMTPAVEGMTVQRQVAFPVLENMPPPESPRAARILEPDVAIIGGGAGGLSAAISVGASGARAVVLDERKVGGGQFYKQSAGNPPLDAQQSEGAALLARVEGSGAEIIGSVEIWGAFDGPLFLAEHEGGALIIRPKTAIIATGAYERPVIAPGWTLPGVMTTGAAQTLWRSYRTLPAQRVAVCGSGPLNVQVALELAQGGAEVVMVAESAPAPWRSPVQSLAALKADPVLLLRGMSMLRDLKRRGVPLKYLTQLERVEKERDHLRASFRSASDRQTDVEVDAVCMNAGFEPQNEILRLLGARMSYDAGFGHLRCQRGPDLETSVRNIFAVGDCAGTGGAPAARVEGEIAGRAAAARAGFGDSYDLFALRSKLARHRRFQARLWTLYNAAPASLDKTPPDTLLCRCEEIALGDVQDDLEVNPGHVGTLKRSTRVGMGRCQGRYCGPVAARLVAEATGKALEDLSFFAPRVPIKPVTIAAILAAKEALGDDG